MQVSPTTIRRLAASRSDMPIMTPRPATVERPQKSAQMSANPVPLLSPARSNETPISAGCATETKIPARIAIFQREGEENRANSRSCEPGENQVTPAARLDFANLVQARHQKRQEHDQ